MRTQTVMNRPQDLGVSWTRRRLAGTLYCRGFTLPVQSVSVGESLFGLNRWGVPDDGHGDGGWALWGGSSLGGVGGISVIA